MKRQFILMALLASAACTRSPSAATNVNDESGIIRGSAISAEDPIFKSIVRIHEDGRKICSGVLVKDNMVLTAAHCIDLKKLNADSLTVYLPVSADLTCALAKVDQIVFPPDSEKDQEGVHQPDLAILKLSSNVCEARPAKLADHAAVTDDVVTTAGFGIGTTSGRFADRIDIRLVKSDWDSVEALYSDFDWNVPIEAAQLRKLRQQTERLGSTYQFAVALNPEQSICKGDSGGPVYVVKNGEVQVVALNGAVLQNRKRGVRECDSAYLQLVTPLEPRLAWIKSVLAE
jgi:V8-like Glu-specific endopeptidase